MAETPKESAAPRGERMKQVFRDIYLFYDHSGPKLINGAHITHITTRKVGDNWEVTFHLADGSKETVMNKYIQQFVTEVFGPDPDKA